MASRVAKDLFQNFERSKLKFVRELADLSNRQDYIQVLLDEDALNVAIDFVRETNPIEVRRHALTSISQLCVTPELARGIVECGVLNTIIMTAVKGAPVSYLIACVRVIKVVASLTLLDASTYNEIISCLLYMIQLDDGDLRHISTLSLESIASKSASQCAVVVSCGALPLLLSVCLDSNTNNKEAAVSCIGTIAAHGEAFADEVVSAEAGMSDAMLQSSQGVSLSSLSTISILTNLLRSTRDTKLRRVLCSTFASLFSYVNVEESVDARLFPAILACLHSTDASTKHQASICVSRIVSRGPKLASVISECGGIGSLIQYLSVEPTKGDKTAAILALGTMASYSPSLAQSVVDVSGLSALKSVLVASASDSEVLAAIRVLREVGKHNETLADTLAEADIFRHIVAHARTRGVESIFLAASECVDTCAALCSNIPALQAVLPSLHLKEKVTVVFRILSLLKDSLSSRRLFLSSGGLKVLQRATDVQLTGLERNAEELIFYVEELVKGREEINRLYPADVVEYCSQDYMARLAEKVDQEIEIDRMETRRNLNGTK